MSHGLYLTAVPGRIYLLDYTSSFHVLQNRRSGRDFACENKINKHADNRDRRISGTWQRKDITSCIAKIRDGPRRVDAPGEVIIWSPLTTNILKHFFGLG
jgi:hypothetical protein